MYLLQVHAQQGASLERWRARVQGLGTSMSTFAAHLFVPTQYADRACGKAPNGSADAPHDELPDFAAATVRPCATCTAAADEIVRTEELGHGGF